MTTDRFQTITANSCSGTLTGMLAGAGVESITIATESVEPDYQHLLTKLANMPSVAVELSKHVLPVYALPLFLAQQVVNVQVFNNHVVKLTFADDTVTTAVCSDADVFSLEVGISICLMKRMMSCETKKGSSLYNKAIKTVLGKYQALQEDAMNKESEEKRRKQKWQKACEKKELRRKRKEEHAIEIQKEAYIRAMNEMKASQS